MQYLLDTKLPSFRWTKNTSRRRCTKPCWTRPWLWRPCRSWNGHCGSRTSGSSDRPSIRSRELQNNSVNDMIKNVIWKWRLKAFFTDPSHTDEPYLSNGCTILCDCISMSDISVYLLWYVIIRRQKSLCTAIPLYDNIEINFLTEFVEWNTPRRCSYVTPIRKRLEYFIYSIQQCLQLIM